MIFTSHSCCRKSMEFSWKSNLRNFCIQRFQATRLRCRISASQSCRKCKNLAENKICRISVSDFFEPLGWDAEFLHHTIVVGRVWNLAKSKICRNSASHNCSRKSIESSGKSNLQNFCIERFQAIRSRCRISASRSCCRRCIEFIRK